MLKEKKCKGIGKAISFKGCGKMVTATTRRLGLCFNCYPKFLTETEAGKLIMQKAIIKVSKPRLEFEKKERDFKEKTALKKASSTTKTLVHAFVRERDAFKPCISCGCDWNETFQAGHFYKAENYETLRYDLDNIHGQCVQCNIHLDGNINAYTVNLPKRIGQYRFNELLKKAEVDKHYSKVWDIEKLKEIRKNIRLLKK